MAAEYSRARRKYRSVGVPTSSGSLQERKASAWHAPPAVGTSLRRKRFGLERCVAKCLNVNQGIIRLDHPATHPPLGCNTLGSLRSGSLETDALEAGLPTNPLISIVDDDESVREALTGFMKSVGFTVEAFAYATDFLASLNLPETSCLISDVQMPHMTGVELHSRLLQAGYAIPTILITAYPHDSVRARVLADGAICYLSKPLDEDVLIGCIRSALERAKPDEDHS